MDPAPSGRPSGTHEPDPPSGVRPRIFGTETEYAVLYLPDDPRDSRIPPFEAIEHVLFEALLSGRKAAVSTGLKGGYFLENGGLVHLEIYLRSQADTPILEASTPECRSPWDLLAYQRAFDGILTEVSVKSRDLLARRGYAGKIAFGKNNRDVRGVGYGTHENYTVHQVTGLGARLAVGLAAPAVAILLVPSVFFILVVLGGAIAAATFARLFPGWAAAIAAFVRRRFRRAVEELRAAYFVVMNGLLFLPILLYSTVLRATAFRPFRDDLTSFLATRQILTGAGGLDLRRGTFEMSQRAALVTSLADIVMFGRHKTVFDLKSLLYDPFAIFRRHRKMTITVGDSNLSDVSLFLATGTTALVLEMIEAGVDLSDLRLGRPLRALTEVASGGPWKELEVGDAGPAVSPRLRTAIDIQREYLRRARSHCEGRPEDRVPHRKILALWDEALADLGEAPGRLADRLDWAAKKSLLDAAILPGGWKDFFAWGRFLSRAPLDAVAASGSIDEVLRRVGPLRRFLLGRRIRAARRRGEIRPAEFAAARDRHLAALKIDLRYHEIGADPGYQRQLEAEGLMRRLTTDDEVARAAREAPPDTRARTRGYFISLARTPDAVRANWNSVEVTNTGRTFPLPDPFDSRLPPA